jgi:hypothetical protein
MDGTLIHPPPEPPPPWLRVSFPQPRPKRVEPPTPPPLVSYHIPLEKGKALRLEDAKFNIPPGSMADPTILARPAFPTSPFEFPFMWGTDTTGAEDIFDVRTPSAPHRHDTVWRLVGLMRMCGLHEVAEGCVNLAQVKDSASRQCNPSLLDGGANICLTGVLDLLIDVETVAPVPISVATKGTHCPWMIVARRRASFPLRWMMAPFTTNLVSTAKIWLKPLSLHR